MVACVGFLFLHFFGICRVHGLGVLSFPFLSFLSYFYGLTYYYLVVFVGESSVWPDGMCWVKVRPPLSSQFLCFLLIEELLHLLLSGLRLMSWDSFLLSLFCFACAP